MKLVALIFAILIVLCETSLSAPGEFKDQNFSIEFPPGWQLMDPPPAPSLAVAKTSDGAKSFLIIVTKLPANELSTAAHDMAAGAKQSLTERGFQINGEQSASINGIPFHSLTARISSSASMVAYIGVAGNEGYILEGVCKTSDAGTDPELMAAINSFHLLTPQSIPAESSRADNLAYRIGYITGQILIFSLVGAGLFRLFRKPKTPKAP